MLRAATRLGLRLRASGPAPRLTRAASHRAPDPAPGSAGSGLHDINTLDLSDHLITEPAAFLDDAPLTIVKAVEPTLSSLGLAEFTPPGILQSCLEYFHIALDLPWWGAIAVGTVCVRTIIFPLVIITQRNAAKMHNNMPEMMTIQLKMTQARMANDREATAKYSMDLAKFMKERGTNPLKNMLAPLAQAPFFISFFLGLRGMCECPVESMRNGGLFWFENLTVPDPIYMLPILTCSTMLLIIELGADSGKLPENMKRLRYMFRAIPIITLPITCQFPAAVLCYWVTTNFISLIQVGVLKIPRVREMLKIPKLIEHPPGSIPKMPNPFNMTANDSWENIKISNRMEERNLIDKLLKEKEERKRRRRSSRHTKQNEQ